MVTMSIPEWCESYGFSRGYYYILKRRSEAPQTIRIGRHVRITEQANRDWLRARETASASEAA